MIESEVKKYFEMLFHADKNSNYILANFNKKFSFHAYKVSELETAVINDIDAYITPNGFFRCYRRQEECRQINAVMFDLDCHDKRSNPEWVIGRTLMIINDAIDEHKLTPPNLIVNSGRGLHLYYIFENSISYRLKNGDVNEKALYCYKHIREKLRADLQKLLELHTYTIELDKAVCDIPRLMRIAGTMNSKTGKYARIVYCNYDYCRFDDFISKKKNTKKLSPQVKKTAPAEKKDYKRTVNYDWLQKTRLDELERLVMYRNGDCEGCRDYFSFAYYNAAIQVYDKPDAASKLNDFCRLFSTRQGYAESQVNAIIRSVNKHGYYKISKQYLIDVLHITDDEIAALKLFRTSGQMKRGEVKAKNRADRCERNELITGLLGEGLTHSEIAEMAGVSLRTVQNVLKIGGLVRKYNTQCAK